MKSRTEATNVMRILARNKIEFQSYTYPSDTALSGAEVADILHIDPCRVFKTLVTVAASKNYYVFMIPVQMELDLKKAARIAGEKNVSMIPQKELLPLTGYIHGGCSPVGMKKQFRTYIDLSASHYDSIVFSAGKVGYQVETSPTDLVNLLSAKFSDLCV